jgi:hypothetical protein
VTLPPCEGAGRPGSGLGPTASPRLNRFSASAFTATRTLEPDIEIAAISGGKVKPNGSKTPAAIGRASE